MGFEGMDPDQVEGYGHQLLSEGSSIDHLITSIQAQVTTLAANWLGQDSNEFQQEWSNTYMKQMHQASAELKAIGHAALRNAAEQRNTSAHL